MWRGSLATLILLLEAANMWGYDRSAGAEKELRGEQGNPPQAADTQHRPVQLGPQRSQLPQCEEKHNSGHAGSAERPQGHPSQCIGSVRKEDIREKDDHQH